MGEFIKLISDVGDNPRFAVADAKQLLKLYEEQYAYLGDTLVNQIAKLLGGISMMLLLAKRKGQDSCGPPGCSKTRYRTA